MPIAFYDNFEDFIKHDMDAVVLANYANEHAPFAIRAMKMGKHVFSEVLPVQTMKEAVELVEAVEQTGMIYAYGENYCYMPAPYEMKKLYREGKIGEFEYGECEYVHNCEPIWPSITYGEKDHWRNNMYSTFYCTHSLGPIIHMTGLRPVSVVGFEGTQNARAACVGSKAGSFGIEMVTLENGGIIKSIHGGLYKDSIWYSVYGSKGRMESAREDARMDNVSRIYINYDEIEGGYEKRKPETYHPTRAQDEKAQGFGHGRSDFYSMYNFVEKLLGNPEADTINVYEALDMFLPGMFAYRSILDGNVPKEIPNLRDKSIRDLWRNDTACTDPAAAGDMLQPTFSLGTPEIDDGVYERVRTMWEEERARKAAEEAAKK
jgi:predicted dehydrogenase